MLLVGRVIYFSKLVDEEPIKLQRAAKKSPKRTTAKRAKVYFDVLVAILAMT